MPTKKKYFRHNCYVTEEEDKFVKKFNLSPSKIYHEALTAIRKGVCETPGKRGVYLSNSANQPQGTTTSDHMPGAETAPGPDHVPVAAHAEIRPAQAPAPTIIIVRKRPAGPDLDNSIEELLEPARPVAQAPAARTVAARSAPLSIMHRGLLTPPQQWAQLPDRD